jgi:outer membrane protein assembly factor BamB
MIRSLRLSPLFGLLTTTAACTGVSLGTGSTSSGCGPGGANTNQHSVGDQPGGVQLQAGDIAVAPSGDYVIFQGKDSLAVGFPDTGKVDQLAVAQPTTLAFSKKRDVVYVGSAKDLNIHAIDVKTRKELWATPAPETEANYLRLESSGDDTRLLAVGLGHVTLIDAGTGKAISDQDMGTFIVDARILPDSGRALVVLSQSWSQDPTPLPTTPIKVIEMSDGKSHDFSVPNCASTLAITPDGKKAFLSPTSCNKDPVSLLDLTAGAESWVKNLPGFGPLVVGPDGATAVAFLDTQNLDESLFDDKSQIPPHAMGDTRYYIMTLDTETLKYELTSVGDALPRYALTPDGEVLLVDSTNEVDATLRLFDTKLHTFRDVKGAAVKLDNFVISSDAKHVFALAPELVDIDVPASVATPIVVPFVPTNINISADDQTLFLRHSPTEICIFSLEKRACRATFTGELLASP